MTSNVVMPSKFLEGLDEQGLQQLEDSGIVVDRAAEFDALELADFVNGDVAIGTLTSEEMALFVIIALMLRLTSVFVISTATCCALQQSTSSRARQARCV